MINLFAIAGLCAICGLTAPNGFDLQFQNESFYSIHENIKTNPKLATYNDNNYEITLSVDDLTNYIWQNAYNFVSQNNAVAGLKVDNVLVPFSEFDEDYQLIIFDHDGDSVVLYGDFDLLADYYGMDDSYVGLDYSFYSSPYFGIPPTYVPLTLVSTSAYYDGLKTAIELDIQANNPVVQPVNAFDDIISTLVGGIAGIASGVGAGVSDLVANIFVDNGNLSVFGFMVVIFAGLSLAIGLSRWIMNFLTSLGAKK